MELEALIQGFNPLNQVYVFNEWDSLCDEFYMDIGRFNPLNQVYVFNVVFGCATHATGHVLIP